MGARALVLFAHGARSASWAAPFERLREMVAARAPGVDVSLAFLELMSPRLPERVAALAAHCQVPAFESSYFLSRETVVPTHGAGMASWRERLFAFMSRQASGAAAHFHLPDNAVVELGTRMQI